MAIIGAPKSWEAVANRTTLAENKTMSKAVRRYGKDGSRLDSTYGSTGGHTAHESEVAPSAPPKHMGSPATTHRETVGWVNGQHHTLTLPNSDRHGNAVYTTEPLRPEGQAWSASGGKFGKAPQRPGPQRKSHSTTAPSAVLDGDPVANTAYQGGRGPIR